MPQHDYVILGGGCAGLSLAYELEIHNELQNSSLAIVEPRTSYKRDKTWSFWKVRPHHFEDCVNHSWNDFRIHTDQHEQRVSCPTMPYQTIDSGIFYQKINQRLRRNPNITFHSDTSEVDLQNALIFDSVPRPVSDPQKLWQHFKGIEISTKDAVFDKNCMTLMDFRCDQRERVHFFYVLPYNERHALIESTWLSTKDDSLYDYDDQIKQYMAEQYDLRNYQITFEEQGAIPLFTPPVAAANNVIPIGTTGGMTRCSTGYTFLNIQMHSQYIRQHLSNISTLNRFSLAPKYHFLDNVFLQVLRRNPEKMPAIFSRFFTGDPQSSIRFLSNTSSAFDDLATVLKMPKWVFIKALLGY